MKVCVLSTYGKFQFAQDLVMGALGSQEIMISCINEVTKDIKTKGTLKRELENADIVLAVIDQQFHDNELLSDRLSVIASMVRRDPKKMLIPIILDNAVVPEDLGKTIYLECTSSSEKSLENTKLTIRELVEKRKFTDIERKSESKRINVREILLWGAIYALALFGAFSMLTIVVAIWEKGTISIDFSNDTAVRIIVYILLLYFAICGKLFIERLEDRWNDIEEKHIESYSRRLQQTIVKEKVGHNADCSIENEDDKNEVIDALGRMLINLEDIKEFYTWSQRQAKQSFFLSVGLCILGFALIVVSVVLIVVSDSGYEVAIVATIGGVTTELIAGTALVVYKNSLSQLNHYHKALHEDERFLSSVNLLGKFSTIEAQDDMLREIIRSEIQINLAGVNDNKGQGTEKEKI